MTDILTEDARVKRTFQTLGTVKQNTVTFVAISLRNF